MTKTNATVSAKTLPVLSLSTRIEKDGGNGLTYLEHLESTGLALIEQHKIRIEIHVDGYASQSFGRVDRFDGSQWQNLASIRGAALLTDLKLFYSRDRTAARFADDRARLLTLAAEVLR